MNSEEAKARLRELELACTEFQVEIVRLCGALRTREVSMAIARAQEAKMWGRAAIERDPQQIGTIQPQGKQAAPPPS